MIKFAPRLMVLLLCGTALAGCADTDIASLTGGKPTEQAKADTAKVPQAAPTDLDGGIRQAQLLRQAEHYDEAVHILSQLMLVASDDGRVVGEYGKTLVQMGRAQDAAEFLGRAVQLQPNDWTAYSALGVAYDQLGNQASARMAYDHALTLRPEEPSILNNYALSRMLANDPTGAHQLIERARLAGGANDPKIARNIALVDKLAAAPEEPRKVAAASQAAAPELPKPVVAAQAVTVAPINPVGTPRPLQPAQTTAAVQQTASTVVMQRVPIDPLAGPARAKKTAAAPAPAAAKVASKPVADTKLAVKTDSKPALVVARVEVKPAADNKLAVKTDGKPAAAVAKVEVKPAADNKLAVKTDSKPAVTVAKVEVKPAADSKPAVKTDSKPVVSATKIEVKPAADNKLAVKTDSKPAVTVAKVEVKPTADNKLAVKTDGKPAVTVAKVEVKPAAPVKTADAQTKNGVPALRMTADRY